MSSLAKLVPFPRSTKSVIVRDLGGNIVSFNREAARQYGFTPDQALGSVSHHLFSTVFPYPLEQINDELLSSGVWEGELLHTLSDGRRVKVQSRWELNESDGEDGLRVVEVNSSFESVHPSSAHLRPAEGVVGSILRVLNSRRRIWIGSALVVIVALKIFFELTEEVALIPMFE